MKPSINSTNGTNRPINLFISCSNAEKCSKLVKRIIQKDKNNILTSITIVVSEKEDEKDPLAIDLPHIVSIQHNETADNLECVVISAHLQIIDDESHIICLSDQVSYSDNMIQDILFYPKQCEVSTCYQLIRNEKIIGIISSVSQFDSNLFGGKIKNYNFFKKTTNTLKIEL